MKDRIILLPYLEAAAYDEFRGIVGDAAPPDFAGWKAMIDRTGLHAAIRTGATVRYAGVDFGDLRRRLEHLPRPTNWDELLQLVAHDRSR